VHEDILPLLCCPLCKGDLQLTVGSRRQEEIWTGELTCPRCAAHYPISGGIPNLLPPAEREG